MHSEKGFKLNGKRQKKVEFESKFCEIIKCD